MVYKSAEALLIKMEKSLPGNHFAVLKAYYEECRIEGMSHRTIENKLIELEQLAKFTSTPFKQLTKEDIKQYLLTRQKQLQASSLSIKKSIIKHFFKWLYQTDEYPEVVRWIKTSYSGGNDYPTQILTPDEVKFLIDKAETVQHKAMIATLFDTAIRVGELVNMNINDIEFDENGSTGTVVGKTGLRLIRFIHSLPLLSQWLEIHPHKQFLSDHSTDKKYPLWVSASSRNKNERLTTGGVYDIISWHAYHCGLKKKVTPHSFRHARLTDLAMKGLNEPTLRVIAGWQPNSSMTEVYVHLSSKDGTNTLLQVEKDGYVKPERVESPLKPSACPRCKTENAATGNYCVKCGMPLDETQIIKRDVEVVSNPLDLLAKMKEYINNYETLVNGIWDILTLKNIMEHQNQITRDQLRHKIDSDHFDRLYSDWVNVGLVKESGKMVVFPESSKKIVERYVDFWGECRNG